MHGYLAAAAALALQAGVLLSLDSATQWQWRGDVSANGSAAAEVAPERRNEFCVSSEARFNCDDVYLVVEYCDCVYEYHPIEPGRPNTAWSAAAPTRDVILNHLESIRLDGRI
jgi:hypothetical protein